MESSLMFCIFVQVVNNMILTLNKNMIYEIIISIKRKYIFYFCVDLTKKFVDFSFFPSEIKIKKKLKNSTL